MEVDMSDIFDKAILIGMGLEKKAKEVLEELQKSGEEKKKEAGVEGKGEPGKGGEGEELTPRQVVENKVVDEGVKVLKEFLSAVKGVKDKIEKEVATSSDKVLGKLHVATEDELDVIKEMARVAREKVDELEKRVSSLEKGKKEEK